MTDAPAALCPTCASPARSWLSGPHWDIYRCTKTACGLAFAHPPPTDEWLAAIYARDFSFAAETIGHGSTPEPYVRILLDALESVAGPVRDRRMLDFGAGIGTMARSLVERGARLDAVEQNEVGQAEIRAIADVPVAGTISALAEAGAGPPYDVIMMVEVIEHLRDPLGTLVELRAALGDGGALFITTPNISSLRSRLEGARWTNVEEPTHIVYFNARSLRYALRKAGFDRVEPVPEAGWHPELSPSRRALHRLLQPLGLAGGLQFLARPDRGR